MEFAISTLLSGISVGGQYALIAIGYTMVYGILRLINFAHGDVFMVSGLVMIFLTSSLPWYVAVAFVAIMIAIAFLLSDVAIVKKTIGTVVFGAFGIGMWVTMNKLGVGNGVHVPWYIAIGIVAILIVLLGFSVERVAYKPLRTAPRMSVMISAIGVSYLIQNVATYVTGGQPMEYPKIPFLSEMVNIGGATTSMVTVVTPVLVILLVIALVLLINHTKVGMAMRALSKDFETSQLMGIKINKVISMTFVIGSFLAAVGSFLYFSNYTRIYPVSGAMPGLKAFVAAVFGGIGSIPGAVIGAFIIGICENIIKALPPAWDVSNFVDAFTFALLIIILIAKPTGLFGEKSTDKV